MGGLVGDELAGVWRCPVLVPVDGERPGSLLAELALVGAAEVLVLVVPIVADGTLSIFLDDKASLMGAQRVVALNI